MNNQFSLFDLLLLIGITQGVITSVLLFRSKNNSRSNPFLALAILAFCFLCTKMLLHTLELWETPTFRYFPNGVELAIAPLFYFYIVSLLDAKFKFGWKQLLHFLPFLLSQSFAFWVYYAVIGVDDIEQKDTIARSLYFDEVKNTEDYLSFLSLSIYLSLAYLQLKSYRKWLKDHISDTTSPSFNWLRRIFIGCAILGVLLFVNLLTDIIFQSDVNKFFRWQVYFVFIAFLIYYLGFVGYKQPHFEIEEIEKPEALSPSAATSTLSEEKEREIVSALEQALVNQKVFLNPTLNIQQLSKLLGVSTRNLSYVINTSFQKKFRDLINDYRVNEVKSKLVAEEYQHLSILGVALECGFNSEASFYRIFKKNTGLSPKEYADQALKTN